MCCSHSNGIYPSLQRLNQLSKHHGTCCLLSISYTTGCLLTQFSQCGRWHVHACTVHWPGQVRSQAPHHGLVQLLVYSADCDDSSAGPAASVVNMTYHCRHRHTVLQGCTSLAASYSGCSACLPAVLACRHSCGSCTAA